MASILRIKDVIKEKGLTINKLAEQIGVNRVTLSNIINGDPKFSSLQKIADTLKVDVQYLILNIDTDLYKIHKNVNSNNLSYSDKHFSLSSFLPHLTNGEYGSFKLDFINKDFSVVPSTKEIYDFIISDRSVDEIIYMNNLNNKIGFQLFSMHTYLSEIEYKQLVIVLELFKKTYKQLYKEVMVTLGTLNYDRTGFGKDYYKLGYVDVKTWEELIAVTRKYDLDTPYNKIGKFNATGQNIILYDDQRQDIKMWIGKDDKESYGNQIMLIWNAPTGHKRNKIISGDIFNAIQSYNFIFNTMLGS